MVLHGTKRKEISDYNITLRNVHHRIIKSSG